jgi:F0F1-type ATP synthase assembly protein I
MATPSTMMMTSDSEPKSVSGTKPPSKAGPRMQGANAGYLLFAGALLGLGIGALCDQWLDSGHTGLLIGFGIGTAAGLYHMIREGTR